MKKIIILVVVIIIIGLIYIALPKSTASVPQNPAASPGIEYKSLENSQQLNTSTSVSTTSAVTTPTPSTQSSTTKTPTTSTPGITREENTANRVATGGVYEAYSPDKIALATSDDVILFFHAPWCPTCRGADADIVKNSANIPEHVRILKTDYDSNTDLKKKYGVTYQHTFVQVDEKGNMITKWSGSATLADIVAHVK
jgi:thioredoxin 1